jgi:hypothetical protein
MKAYGSLNGPAAAGALLLLLLLGTAATGGGAEPPATEADLATGVRQVDEGDFETAVLTLDAVVRNLAAASAPQASRARASPYLGIAHLALDQRETAKTCFREALGHDPGLRLGPDRFSPKVIAAFDEARLAFEAARSGAVPSGTTTASPRRGGGGGKAALVVGAAALAGGGIALAVTGDGDGSGGGAATVANARFETPVVVCPDETFGAPLTFSLRLDVTNGTKSPLTLSQASTVIRIEASAIPSEIGFASNAPSRWSPLTVAAGDAASVRVESSLTCDNALGDAPRFNEWSGSITLTTSAGVFTAGTVDRMRVNIP